ncbi:MAG: CopG family transcriptional regulator [Candidatus Limnocylindrales bacterium]
MSTTKVSTTLTQELVVEAKTRVGERGFSRYLDAALARQLQFDRLADLEHELEHEFGPIPADARRHVDEMEWPA